MKVFGNESKTKIIKKTGGELDRTVKAASKRFGGKKEIRREKNSEFGEKLEVALGNFELKRKIRINLAVTFIRKRDAEKINDDIGLRRERVTL